MNKPSQKAFFYVVIFGLFVQFFGALFYFIIYANSPLVRIIYLFTKTLLIFLPITLIFSGYKLPVIPTAKDLPKSLQSGFLSGLLISIFIFAIFFWHQDFFQQFSSTIRERAVIFNILGHYVLFAALFSIIHSLLEEYYWRWFIFRGLLFKCSPATASIISSLAFASHHYIILSQFFPYWLALILGTAVGLGGFLWCWIYYRTNSFMGAWVSHIFIDASVLMVVFFIIF